MGTEKNPNPPEKLTEYREGYPAVVKAIRAVEKPVICSYMAMPLELDLSLH